MILFPVILSLQDVSITHSQSTGETIMSGYIVSISRPGVKFHVGDPLTDININDVDYIDLGGHELEFAIKYCGAHDYTQKIVTYYDDEAREIIKKWKELKGQPPMNNIMPQSSQSSQSTKTPHVHAELIKAWADGAEIQFFNPATNEWTDIESPDWMPHVQYRIKPEKKPDIHMYYNATFYPDRKFTDIKDCKYHLHLPPTLKLTFDGDSGQLIAAEVIK